jgi:chromosome segregation ATPase
MSVLRIGAHLASDFTDASRTQAEKRNINTSYQQHEAILTELQNKIAEEQQKIDASNGGSSRQISEKIRQLQDTIATLEAESLSAQAVIEELETHRQEEAARLAEVREQIDHTGAEVGEIESRIRGLQRQRQDTLLAFGDRVPALLAAIDRETWDAKPLGPIGRYVQLTEPRWAPVLESVFGPLLNSFVVTTRNDKVKLMNLTRQMKAT